MKLTPFFKSLMLMIFLGALLLGYAGNPEANDAVRLTNQEAVRSGSPYRWRAEADPGVFNSTIYKELIGKPGQTAADSQTQADILKIIGNAEVKYGGSQTPSLVETRVVSQTSAEVDEVWIVSRGDKQIAYTVTMKPSPKSGTDFSVKGPWENGDHYGGH